MMYKCFLVGWFVLANLSCRLQPTQPDDNAKVSDIPSMSNSKLDNRIQESDVDHPIESFTDDSHIGVPHKNKVELNNYKRSSGNLAVIKFFSLTDKKEWKLKQTFEFEKDDLTDCEPHIEDFNNDGFKDFTYNSNVAARGANEIRKLFIYDKKNNELVYIKNSEKYPNMAYNKKLDCIDAWRVYGGTSTDFLRIDGDVLREFASVENFDGKRTVTVIDSKGRQRVIRRDKITDDDLYTRYNNFKPLEY